ncbi:FluG domain-containing protein [Sclerotinia borealis F-4128]|uniref:FluG domain-containing protein n=1 Tax=Sclerotinia borealis (strain F-4128) TaxID=1432307 RepID=W9CAR4_SCLBF|nr:FluG domain-containing protein [Sclerotinia borealis F-4128]
MLYNRASGCQMDTNDGKEALKYIDTFGLDNTVKSKPVLGGCRPAELVDAQKKRKNTAADDIFEGDDSNDDFTMDLSSKSVNESCNNGEVWQFDLFQENATEAVRDQVMRRKANSAVFNGAYINERIRFDVQSAVLERSSADGVLRMLTHMSHMRDPRAPINVPNDVLAALPPDPYITALEQERHKLKGASYRIEGTEIKKEVRRLSNAIATAKSRRRNVISEEYRADYFRCRPTEDIEKQNNGHKEEEYVEFIVEYQITERKQLAELLCTLLGSTDPQDSVARRLRAANLMLKLWVTARNLNVTGFNTACPTNFREGFV